MLSIALALLLAACGNSAQRTAYDEALKLEQTASAEQLAHAKAAYARVIAMEPGSSIAKDARLRLEAVEAKIKAHQTAEDQKQSVFHQTGVD